jgi:formylglycine-generating enzyme required for sulfatase activity
MYRLAAINSAILLLVCIVSVSVLAQVLTPDRERALKPKNSFKECEQCPEMVVLPSGSFTMGSPDSEKGHFDDEGPQHIATIAKPFAVSKFEVTFDEWDACVAVSGCKIKPDDYGWGRGKQPVINVSWDDAQEYVTWLSKHTGKSYRLLSESEWEYAARAGSTTAYAWGNEIGKGNPNCTGCESHWRGRQCRWQSSLRVR